MGYRLLETLRNTPKSAQLPGHPNPAGAEAGPGCFRNGGKGAVFPKANGRPVVTITLAAEAAVLLTLDRTDFHGALGREIYGMKVLTPADFLVQQRRSGLI